MTKLKAILQSKPKFPFLIYFQFVILRKLLEACITRTSVWNSADALGNSEALCMRTLSMLHKVTNFSNKKSESPVCHCDSNMRVGGRFIVPDAVCRYSAGSLLTLPENHLRKKSIWTPFFSLLPSLPDSCLNKALLIAPLHLELTSLLLPLECQEHGCVSLCPAAKLIINNSFSSLWTALLQQGFSDAPTQRHRDNFATFFSQGNLSLEANLFKRKIPSISEIFGTAIILGQLIQV